MDLASISCQQYRVITLICRLLAVRSLGNTRMSYPQTGEDTPTMCVGDADDINVNMYGRVRTSNNARLTARGLANLRVRRVRL